MKRVLSWGQITGAKNTREGDSYKKGREVEKKEDIGIKGGTLL